MKIKTRFAPSPTGYLHVGGARTALYSWLFARNHGGEFVLRIEDTDLERSTPEAIEAIMDGMNWLSLEWDEGPYYQTKRFDRYNAVIDQMLEEGTAYKCYCEGVNIVILNQTAAVVRGIKRLDAVRTLQIQRLKIKLLHHFMLPPEYNPPSS